MIATVAAWLVRTIGIGGCVALGIVAFYEGVPLARKIPFIDRVDFIGPLIAGRVELERRAARAERDRYWIAKVAEAERTLERERVVAARDLAAIEAAYNAERDALAAADDKRAADLKIALQRAREAQGQANENRTAPCRCTDLPVDPGILQHIR
ncbi:MAG: hypothetical protein AAF903_12205 [Pseudomonadota bacterium]